MTMIPDSHVDLLERPLFAHLATVRPDGTPQVTPMWYAWDGSTITLTTSTQRAKYRQMLENPNVSLAVHDPDQPYRYLEVRGVVEQMPPDPDADFFFSLSDRYGLGMARGALDDAPTRVKVLITPTRVSTQ